LIHGLGRYPTSLSKIARTLRRHQHPVLNWPYASMRQTLTAAAEDLFPAYQKLAASAEQVDVVTHSMGGIVLRRLLALTPLPQLGRIVMIAPPNNGSLVAQRLLDNPLLRTVLGPAAQELCDNAHLQASCALPSNPLLVIAGTKSRDMRNPISLLTSSFLDEPSDGTVTVAETRLPRMDQFIEVFDCHTWLMNHSQTIRALVEFLAIQPA
jgi:pimeloyl-ACP methyl ester carboxylesterase